MAVIADDSFDSSRKSAGGTSRPRGGRINGKRKRQREREREREGGRERGRQGKEERYRGNETATGTRKGTRTTGVHPQRAEGWSRR